MNYRIGYHTAKRSMVEHSGAIHQIRAFAELRNIHAECGKALIVVAAKPAPGRQHQQGIFRQIGYFSVNFLYRHIGIVDKDKVHPFDRGNAGFEILFKFPAFRGVVGEHHDGTGIGVQCQSGAERAFRVVLLNDAGDVRVFLFDTGEMFSQPPNTIGIPAGTLSEFSSSKFMIGESSATIMSNLPF